MKRLALLLPVLVALQVGVQPALAWTWPVDGPVLRPFVLGDDPYAGGQHRGIDIGAPSGTPVRAPAAGSVSFAGTVPKGGKTVTIRTAEGYAVTLLHLGAYWVTRGAAVGEGDLVGSVGAGDGTGSAPYLYLGIRRADEPDGYVDPLGLLPAAAPAPQDPVPADPVPHPAPEPGSGVKHDAPTPSPHAAPVEASLRKPAHAGHSHLTRSVRSEPLAKEKPAALGRPTHGRRHVFHAFAPRAHISRTHESAPIVSGASSHDSHDPGMPWLWALSAAAAVGLALCLVRRRQLGDTGPANGPSAVLLESASLSAKDADGLWLGQQDDVVLHRDLERILLGEGKALADLDRNHDPAEVVDVADDPRVRCSPGRAGTRGWFSRSVRPQRVLAFACGRLHATRPRVSLFLTIKCACGVARSHSYDCHA
jgi:Peptidase family M23